MVIRRNNDGKSLGSNDRNKKGLATMWTASRQELQQSLTTGPSRKGSWWTLDSEVESKL